MKQPIEVVDEVDVAAAVIAPMLSVVLQKMIDGEAPYKPVRLSLELQALQMELDATVSVPIRVRGEPRSAGAARWFDVSIEAAKRAELFPRFSGTVFTNAIGPAKAEVWLRGAYEPPLGPVGGQVDATLLRGIAERALRQFLDQLTMDALGRAQAAEREIARVHFSS